MKTYLKTLFLMFKKHLARFLSIFAMLFVSIGFISGIGSSTDVINNSLSKYYKEQNVSDFIIKSKSSDGFSSEEIAKVKEIFKEAKIDFGISLDLKKENKRSLRIYFLDFAKWEVNLARLKQGELVDNDYEAYCESGDNIIKGCTLGETIKLDFKQLLVKLSEDNNQQMSPEVLTMLDKIEPIDLKVKGIIQSPLTFSLDGEPSYNNEEDIEITNTTTGTKDLDCLENIIYLSNKLIPTYKDVFPFISEENNKAFLNISDLYIAFNNRELFNAFSSNYKETINEYKEKLNSQLENVKVLTLMDNYSFNSLKSYSDKVANISYIIMLVFLFVTVLVVFTTMTRLLEEERNQIACLKTLGYSSFKIVFKYLLYAFIAMELGAFGAYFVGFGIARLIYYIFNYSYTMPPVSLNLPIYFYLIAYLVIVIGTLIVTAFSGFKMCNEKPAVLLLPKAPKPGKKVILEKIPFIWNKLTFKYKSTTRNVLRYKNRFIMLVVSIAFSMALVLIGLGIVDLCLMHDFNSISLLGIGIIVVIFAGLLTGIAIYTLTNINISERNREIATLMVLGYNDQEVLGYIYREIYLTAFIGIIVGYPFSILLLDSVFKTIDLGSVKTVSWFMWLIGPILVILFTFIVTSILRKKILKINMNTSLKAIE